MSKKHFIALADAIKEARKYEDIEFTETQLSVLAGFCSMQNSRFNRQRWFDYIEGKCGPNGGKVK